MRNLAFLSLLLLCTSCHKTNSNSNQVLSGDRFKSVYIALLKDSEKHFTFPGDTTRHPSADSIFRAFNTSEAEFRMTVASYKGDPRKWQEFYEGVVKTLDDEQKRQVPKPGA